MSSWMNEAAVQNHNGNGFPPNMNDPNHLGAGMMDPSAFMANPAGFNPQFANPQMMQQPPPPPQQNGGPMRNASPSYPNAAQYQTNQVIPSKRARPREDSIGASPQQNPNMLPTSRADTPHQQSPFPGFQPNAMPQGQNPGQPQHFPHLQPNGSANASPSPVMAGNQIRPGSVPGRVNTASPHPFSPASQQFPHQGSPVPSEHGGTPQPNPYMQNQNFPQGFNPNMPQSPSPARPPSAQNPMMPQMMPQQMGQMPQQMQQMHPNQMFSAQQQMQQQMQQMQGRPGMDPQQQKMMYMRQQMMQSGNMQMAAQMQAQNMAQGRGMMPKQGMPMQNGQMPPGAMRPGQPPQMGRGMQNADGFMKSLSNFMASKQLPLDMNPSVEGRPIPLLPLFQMVSKFGGFRNVTGNNMWNQITASFGFQQQTPSAAGQVKAVYERNLLKFEEAYAANQQKQQAQMKQQQQQQAQQAQQQHQHQHQQHPQQQQQPPQPQPSQPQQQQPMPQQQQQGMPGAPHPATPQRMGQMPPGQQMPPSQPPQQMPPAHAQTPVKQMTPAMQQANMNGFSTPQPPQASQQPPSATPAQGKRSVEPTPTVGEFPMNSPVPPGSAGSMAGPQPPPQADGGAQPGAVAGALPPAFATNPDEYVPCSRELNMTSYGGFDLASMSKLGLDLEKWKPDVPLPHELGVVDIQALTRSIQCGIHGEVRLALDTLANVTRAAETFQPLIIDLRACEDLIECLVDCAEEQVDLLVEKAEPVSDEIDLSSYEDIVRQCRAGNLSLRKVPAFGDDEYELEHAADRLVAITTIFRNLSFLEFNQGPLADETVVKFLCGVIRSLGTHENLLRVPRNTLDFMKDVIILMSNIAGAIELPGREQALCLLQFLLAFAPTPTPSMSGDKVVFTFFEPSLHPYLPHAVDALAKLLARDEPNRTHYKHIFATDASSSPPHELLTRTFAIAISPIPDSTKESRPANMPSFVEARKPLLMQGLLAADILAQLAPSYETGVTRAWLSSGEGFAQNLFRLVRTLCTQAEPMPRPGANPRSQPREDPDLFYIILCGVSTLKRLTEKSRDPNDAASIPPMALPSRDSLLGALQSLKTPKWTAFLNQLSAYAGLND